VKKLSTFPTVDGLTQVLLRLTVTSSLYCLSDMTAPWGFRVAARSMPAFHLLTKGAAWLEIEAEPEPVQLAPGDLVILPRGDGHVVRDAPRSPVLWLDRILTDTPPVDGRLRHGGGGAASELLCGGFAVDLLMAQPLLEALPRVVHLRGSDGRAPEWLAGLMRMIAVEAASNSPGSEAVVTRLTDALLAQALRQALLEADASLVGVTAVSDPQIARALRLVRERVDDDWTVPKMAAAVGLSRSTFAERFRAATGETPIQHLTRYRLARAAEYLRTTNAAILEIARRTGYESEVSISKAFRREFGVSPGAYRRSQVASPAPR
jgi:AraC-like DNA-binding protein